MYEPLHAWTSGSYTRPVAVTPPKISVTVDSERGARGLSLQSCRSLPNTQPLRRAAPVLPTTWQCDRCTSTSCVPWRHPMHLASCYSDSNPSNTVALSSHGIVYCMCACRVHLQRQAEPAKRAGECNLQRGKRWIRPAVCPTEPIVTDTHTYSEPAG